MLAFWCQHESVLALQREQYKESHCLERKKKKKNKGARKLASGSVPPPRRWICRCVWRAVRARDSTSPLPSQRERMSYPSIHSFIYSLIHLCARPWAWYWRHWVLGTDDKVLLAERPVQGGKTVKKETQKGRYIFANPDNHDQSHPHCYRGRRLRPREGQRELGVTQQVSKGPRWAPGWTF